MAHNAFTLDRHGVGFRLSAGGLLLDAVTEPPQLSGLPAEDIRFIDAGRRPAGIAGIAGTVFAETSAGSRILLTREFFLSDDGRYFGLRLKIRNTSSQPAPLHSIRPLHALGDKQFQVGGGAMPTWRVLRLSRHKGDVPGVFRPGTVDQDYRDAAFNAQSIPAGMGIQGDLDSRINLQCVMAEPATFIKNDRSPDAPGLFMCVLGQQRHLTSFYLMPSEDHRTLKEFGVLCEFDEIIVDPGEEARTHWIVMYQAGCEAEALDQYVALQARRFDIRPPADRLNLYCSWYFYGREFLPADLDENLDVLRRRPIPFHAFIIDNGWMDAFGDWNANDKWPGGMAKAAEKIRNAGMMPGIWTAPFLLMEKSRAFKANPELIARGADGRPSTFGYVEGDCFILDPTSPRSREYLAEYLGRLKSWGFTYHKLDFTRALAVHDDIRFQDRHVNRAGAYRLGLKLVREALGDTYFQSCGGILDAGNYGLADSIRVGSDSIGAWDHYSGQRIGGTEVQIKQSLVRNYLSRLIHTDPDSLMLRRRTQPFRLHAASKHNRLSDGKFTDEEAFSLVVRQYLTGGNTDVSERLAELPDDRRALLRHIIPAFAPPARILDMETPGCPTLGLTEIVTSSEALGRWHTLSVSNWDDKQTRRTLNLAEVGLPRDQRFAVLEFRGQRFLGVLSADQPVELEIPAHGTVLLRIAPWQGKPLIVGTDLHLSGGGCELQDVRIESGAITGRVVTKWDYPVRLSACFPVGDGAVLATVTVNPPQGRFCIVPPKT